jgi:hypothetical protein
MCRAILGLPDLTDEEAEGLLDHLYSVADVVVCAFIEQRGRTEKLEECEPLAGLGNERLDTVIHVA